MLGFHPLSAFELETPGLVEGALSTAATVAAVPLASLAFAGGQPPAQYPELAASLDSSWAVVAPLRFAPALQATASGDFVLTAARPNTPATALRASADVSLQSVQAKLNLASVGLFSASNASFAFEPYTVPLPHAISAAPSFSVAASGYLQVPAALASAASAAWSVGAVHLPVQPALRGAPAVDVAVQTAYLNITPGMRATASLDTGATPYLNTTPTLFASSSFAASFTAPRINLERQLSSNTLISLYVYASRPVILSHALSAYNLVALNGSAPAPTLLPHVPLPPLGGFSPVPVVLPGSLVTWPAGQSYWAVEEPAFVVVDEEVRVPSSGRLFAGVRQELSMRTTDVSVAKLAVVTSPRHDSETTTDE